MLKIKKNISSWFIKDAGISYSRILKYFYPEFITALIVYSLPQFIDFYFICHLKQTSLYAISGIVENFLTMFTKTAEGFLIGTVVVSGYFNGLHEYKKAGKSFVDAFWTTIVIGLVVSICLYFGVSVFYKFNNFTEEMIALGTPYLQLKSVGVFFMFVYFSLVGFLRSVKNTFTPMVVFAMGSCVFVLCDYFLIYGSFGYPGLGLLGSAVAYLTQYIVMSLLMLGYLMYSVRYQKYQISFTTHVFNKNRIIRFLWVSLPVVLDKISIAFAYVWLASCISQSGTDASAAFSMLKQMERLAFIPAIAFSQIITFLVSNDLGHGKWSDIYANIKKVVSIASIMVGCILLVGSIWPYFFVKMYGCSTEICSLVAMVFTPLSVLVMFDLLQLILSGALRGAGDVQTVMKTRIAVIAGYFIPITYVISWLPLEYTGTKMLVTYGAFLIGNGLMSVVYIIRLRQNHLKEKNIKVMNE